MAILAMHLPQLPVIRTSPYGNMVGDPRKCSTSWARKTAERMEIKSVDPTDDETSEQLHPPSESRILN